MAKKRGPKPKPKAEVRTLFIRIRVNRAEHARVKKLTPAQMRETLLAAADALTGKRTRG